MAKTNTIEEALEELRSGHIVLVIDDPDRENEGDCICAAQFATTENVNFMACYAKGTTVIRDAAELKVKESNRITVMAENLRAMGADVTETEDGMIIHGGRPLHGAVIDSKKDHRIAMTFAVTALAAEGETEILDADCVNISYPGFYSDLARLKRK